MKNFIWMLAIAFLLFYSADYDITPGPSTRQISGQVTYVIDGDTFQLSSQLGDIRIRVADIDAPELSQPYGKKAKSYLKSLVESETVVCNILEKDRYGRYIAKINVPGTRNLDIAAEMVRAGYAWHYKKYSVSQELANIEIKAKLQKKGLWSDQGAVAPWIYRQQQNIK
ncbi:thermonuclease family protein [Phascolarctobacterium sp.]